MSSAPERMVLPPVSTSVGAARRFCCDRVDAWGAGELRQVVALLVSELVTNVVMHARTPCEVVIARGDALRIEVIDHDPRPPVRKDHGSAAGSGRGLLLLAELSDDYGVDHDASGKRVWFELGWPTPDAGGVTAAGGPT